MHIVLIIYNEWHWQLVDMQSGILWLLQNQQIAFKFNPTVVVTCFTCGAGGGERLFDYNGGLMMGFLLRACDDLNLTVSQ